jgi:purine-binding chemotaxis protein CheW
MDQHIKTVSPDKITTFFVGDTLCGIDILEIQEINRISDITPVPLAPDYVTGIINLRGKIVPVIDLGARLGLSPDKDTLHGTRRNIIVRFQQESIGLQVDRIGEVLEINPGDMVPTPANIQGIRGNCFKRVITHDQGLIGVLDMAAVIT